MTRIARIEGYASLFNTPDLNGDVVMPGAFRASLRKRGAEGVRFLYQHAPAAPIGRWTHVAEDARGLFVRGELLLSSPTANEVYALVAGGALDGLSIGYRTVRASKHARGAQRFIAEADLWEVSVVTFPMAPGARVLRVGPAETLSPADGEAVFAGALRAAALTLSA